MNILMILYIKGIYLIYSFCAVSKYLKREVNGSHLNVSDDHIGQKPNTFLTNLRVKISAWDGNYCFIEKFTPLSKWEVANLKATSFTTSCE